MRIELKKLMKLQVQTKSGAFLGKIKNIIFETEGQTILQYEVGGLLGKKYLISREQVISIDDKKIVVDDNVVEANGYSPKFGISKQKAKIEPEGAVMRET